MMSTLPKNIDELFELVSNPMSDEDLDNILTYFSVSPNKRSELTAKDDKGRTLMHYIAMNAPNEAPTAYFIGDMYRLPEVLDSETGTPILINLFTKDNDGNSVIALAVNEANEEFINGISEIEAPEIATRAYKTKIEDMKILIIDEIESDRNLLGKLKPVKEPAVEADWVDETDEVDFEKMAEKNEEIKLEKATQLFAKARNPISYDDMKEIEQFYAYDLGPNDTELLFDQDNNGKTIIHYLAENAPPYGITEATVATIIDGLKENARERMLNLILSPDNPSLSVFQLANLSKNTGFLDGLKRSLENLKNDKNLKTQMREKIAKELAALAPEVKKLDPKDAIKDMGDIWKYINDNNIKSDPMYIEKVLDFYERYPFLINTANVAGDTILHKLANNAKAADSQDDIMVPHLTLIAELIKRYGADPAKPDASGKNTADMIRENGPIVDCMIKALTEHDASSKLSASNPNKLDVDRALNAVLGLSKELDTKEPTKPQEASIGKTSYKAIEDFKALSKIQETPGKKIAINYEMARRGVTDIAHDQTHEGRHEAIKLLVDHYLAFAKANVKTKKGTNELGRQLAKQAFIELLSIKPMDHDEFTYIKAKQREACQFLNKHRIFTQEQGLGDLLKSASTELGVKLKTSLLSAFFKEKPVQSKDKVEQSQEINAENSTKFKA